MVRFLQFTTNEDKPVLINMDTLLCAQPNTASTTTVLLAPGITRILKLDYTRFATIALGDRA